MIRKRLAGWLDREGLPAVAALISLAFGLFFTFVWAPHPWGWQGIDAYHELARVLARGETFPTTDVPWGYAYYAAAFYRLFGERLWAPLLGQVIANAFVPLLLYRLVRPLADHRTAALASLIVGVFSFNTVYASTQASDSICSALFMCALVTLSSGWRHDRLAAFALSGLIFGVMPQFRPNLVLLPAVIIGGYLLLKRFSGRALTHAIVFSLVVAALQMPWIVRNYRLTGLLLPTSTHGGVQLWYGTLQVGPYLESRAHNPRSFFDSAAFDYASLRDASIVVEGDYSSCFAANGRPRLVYWTDRDPQEQSVDAFERVFDTVRFAIPPQPLPSAVHFYFDETDGAKTFTAPLEGAANPWIVFVTDDHLGDLDRSNEILDVFDVGRLMRHLAWQEPLPARERLDLDGDGAITERDLVKAVIAVLPRTTGAAELAAPQLHVDADRARLVFTDGSSLGVPKAFGGKQTDFEVQGPTAGALVSAYRTFASIAHPERRLNPGECTFLGGVTTNRVFYRLEPHMMQRYLALAYDNIRRDPTAFVLASAYRAVRLFVILGTDDVNTAQQFRGGRLAYRSGTTLSLAYLLVCAVGVVVAIRQRSALVLFLVPIVYVPLTICFVLTNMRYTVTVQPLMFAFVAVAVITALGLAPDESGGDYRERPAK